MMFCPFLVPAEELGSAELLPLIALYPFYTTIITMELLEVLYQGENGF